MGGMKLRQMMKHPLNMARSERPTCVQIKFQETLAIRMMKDLAVRVTPEMKRNVTRLNRRERSETFVVMRSCDIIYFWRIKGLHTNILDNAFNHGGSLVLLILRRCCACFHTKKQMVMLDLF